MKKPELIVHNYQKRLEGLYLERIRIFNLSKYENDLRKKGFSLIAGIDEVGRGSLAGPVVAAAVILPEQFFVPYLKDSKKLTPQKRAKLYSVVLEKVVSIGIGIVSAQLIDQINIRQATFLAMERAILDLKRMPNYLLVDGFKIPQLNLSQTALIKGEDKSISIASASIIAKVYRDNMMIQYDQKYPQYHFKKNKGYGTEEHLAALKKYGPSAIHRKTFKGVV